MSKLGKDSLTTPVLHNLLNSRKKREWLKEVDSTSLQNALKHLDDAFKRFFKKQNDRPLFKSKKNPVHSYASQCNDPKNGKPTK